MSKLSTGRGEKKNRGMRIRGIKYRKQIIINSSAKISIITWNIKGVNKTIERKKIRQVKNHVTNINSLEKL